MNALRPHWWQVSFGSGDVGGGWGAFLRWWPPSTMWAGPFIFLWPTPRCFDDPILSNFGLCAVCWAHFMCHHKFWPTSVGHPFSFLNSFWCLSGGKHFQKITITIFRLVLQNFAIPGCLQYILFYRYLFSSLSSSWFVIAICGPISVQGNSQALIIIVNCCRVAISNNRSTKWVPSLFFSFLIYFFFLKLIVACRLCIIYVREDDDSNV